MDISVIIPVYNVEDYIEDCIKSVLRQSFHSFEIICVDDGSNDRSNEVLMKYEQADQRIKVLNHTSNRGPSCARNSGLSVAKGKYVYFLDADDMINDDALISLWDEAEKNNCDIVFFDAVSFYQSEKLQKKFADSMMTRRHAYTSVYSGKELFVSFVENNDLVASVPRQFIRRGLLDKNSIRFHEGILHEDELYTFQIMMAAKRVKCIKDRLFHRRYRPDSIMTSEFDERNLIGCLTVYQEIINKWKPNEYSGELCDAIDVYLYRLISRIRIMYEQILVRKPNDIVKLENKRLEHVLYTAVVANNSPRLPKISYEDIASMKAFDDIIIYGAGKFGRHALNILDKHEFSVLGFAVTNEDQNPNFVMGHSVRNIEYWEDKKQSAAVIIAVSERYSSEVERVISKKGYTNLFRFMDGN